MSKFWFGLLILFPLLLPVFGMNRAHTQLSKRHLLNGSVPECSEGWLITGYFTPVETDYESTETSEIEVKGVGPLSFNAEFLKIVFDEDQGFGEGWGKTRFGWYIGNYNGAWHKSDAPLDAHDSPLLPNSIAVDPHYIPNGSVVQIPDLPQGFGDIKFIGNDVGVTVHGKHIDIYTGEGKAAGRLMRSITFEDEHELQHVCFTRPDK
jgi:3D (Asp-Asp-Asp) domain-containing protein